jgi:hypothetical protein
MMEELTAAEEAKKIIDGLSVSSSDNPTVLATLRKAYDLARRATTPTSSSAGALNEVRHEVGLALSDLTSSLQARTLTQEKIDAAKAAVNVWIKFLKGRSEARSDADTEGKD